MSATVNTLPAGNAADFNGRPEDKRLLVGAGRYVSDLDADGLLYAAFVRSPHAHAQIVSIEPGAALAMPGVILVWTAKDCAGLLMPAPNPLLLTTDTRQLPLLASDTAIFLGQPVAVVVASTIDLARAAADEVWVEYTTLEAQTTAMGPAAIEPLAESGWALPDAGSPAEGRQVNLVHQQARVAPFALEPRATLARWDSAQGQLTVWLGVQAPARSRDDLAQTLALPSSKVHVVTPDVGGAFGGKASLYPEDHLLALLARHLGAAVSWRATRSEDFVAASHGRGARLAASLSADAYGQLLSLTASVHFDLGAWVPYSGLVPLRNCTRILPGPYRIRSGRVTGVAGQSHTSAVNIYRGAGRPEAALIMETLIERLARQMGVDVIEFRRRNLRGPHELPATLPSGDWLDAGDYPALLEAACQRFGYATERLQQAHRRQHGELVGIGCALYIEPCGQGFEQARVTALPDGRFEVATGSCSQGQGHSVAFARIAAQVLGVPDDRILVIEGDTALCPDGIGALASRSTAIGGSAVLQAARALKEKLPASPDGGPASPQNPVSAEIRYQAPHEAWSAGCLLVRMVIDSQTGQATIERVVWVDDAGELISPTLAKGQLVGGFAQGLGQAMMERLVYDDQGQLLTGSLMDYAVPRADDMPDIEIHSLPTPSLANALGVRGVGEAGCIGAPAALLNAALDALAPLGVDQLDFPLTSEQLWRAIQAAPSQQPGR